MEWVETTGRTLEEAKDIALDQLGVDESEAEFEVLEEPKAGLFGRVRKEARVRARVRPTKPRSKSDRRDKKSRAPKGGSKGDGKGDGKSQGAGDDTPTKTTEKAPSKNGRTSKGKDDGSDGDGKAVERKSRSTDKTTKTGKAPRAGATAGDGEMTGATLEQQIEIVIPFLEGLLEGFDIEGTVTHALIDDETAEIEVNGSDLGLLIGPKGQTISAIQDLARTVVHRRVDGSPQGRIRLDIAGYRKRRKEALAEFTTRIANEVAESGVAKTLEPMHPADRKVVHDTVNGIDGVKTISEGEDSRRRVVILPAD